MEESAYERICRRLHYRDKVKRFIDKLELDERGESALIQGERLEKIINCVSYQAWNAAAQRKDIGEVFEAVEEKLLDAALILSRIPVNDENRDKTRRGLL